MNPIIRPIGSAFPAFWRFMQCLRRYKDNPDLDHLKNAGKYFTVFPSVLCNGLYHYYPHGMRE
jgi:hypothetical protein